MRDLLTYIGIALIVVLTAAFAAPYLVDFDAHRERVAEELTLASGAQFRLNGPIAVKFLPTPRFSAEKIEIAAEGASLKASKAIFALSLPALLRGKLQFSRATLDEAAIALDADKVRRPAWLAALAFDDLRLRHARLTLLRAGAPRIALAALDLSARIPELQGPFSGRGAFEAAERTIAFNFATDVVAKNALPLKASLSLPEEAGKLDLDGKIDLSKSPSFEGAAKASGKAAPGPWSAEGLALLGLDGALLRDGSAQLGEGPLADKLSGTLRYDAVGGAFAIAAESPNLSGPWTDLFAAPLLMTESAPPLDLRLGAQTLVWRGATWSQAQIVWRPGAPAQIKAIGPGASQLDLSATPGPYGWRGRAQLKAADFAAFATALREAAPAVSTALAGANVHALDASGEFALAPDEWALSNAVFVPDRAKMSGDLRLRPGHGASRPLLVARLNAPALDLDAAPDLGGGFFAGLDLDIALEAQTVRSTRGGELSGDGGRIRTHLLRTDEALRLERLEMRNIGGADLTASASWGRNFAGLQGEAKLKAVDFAPLAQALARLWPGAASKALVARARSLSPADLSGKAGGGGFSINGNLAATKIAASFVPAEDGHRAVALDLAAPEAGALLNQLGAHAVWSQKLGQAKISARSQPDPKAPGAQIVTATAELAGLRGEFNGVAADLEGSFAFEGEAALAGDIGRMLAGFSAAPAQPGLLRLAAHASGRDGALALRNLAGEALGAKISGDLTLDADGISGALRSDKLSGPALLALVLGPPAPVKAGALWSSLSFAPTNFDPPRTRLAIETGDLQPLGAKARFDLTLGPGALSVAKAETQSLDGILRGGFDLRREDAQVTLSGEMQGKGLALKNPALVAKLDFAMKFAGGGTSAAGLIGSLAGEGSARIADLAIEGASADAADRALAATETNEGPFDAKGVAKSLDLAFARGALHRAPAQFAVRLASGQAAFTPNDAGGQGIEVGADLRDGTFSVAVSSLAQELPPGWSVAAPSGAVVWSGPWRTPTRRIDANAFVNAVAIRALEREQARIEKQRREDQERLRALQALPVSPVLPEMPPAPDLSSHPAPTTP